MRKAMTFECPFDAKNNKYTHKNTICDDVWNIPLLNFHCLFFLCSSHFNVFCWSIPNECQRIWQFYLIIEFAINSKFWCAMRAQCQHFNSIPPDLLIHKIHYMNFFILSVGFLISFCICSWERNMITISFIVYCIPYLANVSNVISYSARRLFIVAHCPICDWMRWQQCSCLMYRK